MSFDFPPEMAPKSTTEEAQANEIEALQSIFQDDYEEIKVKAAWNKTTDRSFKLKIRPTLDDEADVTLTVKFTATYPKTAPLLNISGIEDYHERKSDRRMEPVLRDFESDVALA